MKQMLLPAILCATLFSCKNKAATAQSSTNTTTKIHFPFKPKYAIKWEKGDDKNALIVLTCLKKYVAGDVKGAAENFADTCTFIGDNFFSMANAIA